MSEVLVVAAVIYLVRAVRELPPVKRWRGRGQRPWACDLCMALWGSLIVTLLLWPGARLEALVLWWARSSFALVALELLGLLPMLRPPPTFALPVGTVGDPPGLHEALERAGVVVVERGERPS